MSIKTVIIDDETLSRNRIAKFLRDFEIVEIIGEADNGRSGAEIIESLKPDLVFLDIQMPELNGFQMLQNIVHRPFVIFITAYDNYAVKAFEVNAVDYLLKPFSRDRFSSAVQRALSAVESGRHENVRTLKSTARHQESSPAYSDKLESLIDIFSRREKFLDRLTVKNKHEYQVFTVEDIDCFIIDDGLVFLSAAGNRHQIDVTLNRLEERLDPSIFFRAHRKAIVNLRKIKKVVTWGSGSYVIKLSGNESVHLSRDRISAFKARMGIQL